MTSPTAWSSEVLLAKARLYFERAFDVGDQADEVFVFWCHLALEHLARAAIAHTHPALLAGSKRESLIYGLGLVEEGAVPSADSAPLQTVHELCARFVKGYGPAEKATCEETRQRRNAELHSGIAAFADLPQGWLGRFFATCRVLAEHQGLALNELLGPDNGGFAERLILTDAEAVRKEVRRLIEAAKTVIGAMNPDEISRRKLSAEAVLRPGAPLDSHVQPYPYYKRMPCPACGTTVGIRGEVISHGRPRLDEDGSLVATEMVLPTAMSCAVCGLHLSGPSQMTVAGVGDPITIMDYPDPVSFFDVDLSDYRDEFLSSLAEDYAYEDE